MSTALPKISIVTPSYNQGAFIRTTIESVLSQGYPNLEYLIVDGGSTDDSVAIIREYADRLAYCVSEPDRGQSHAINKGFARATGDILGWLNSDDRLEPGCLDCVVDHAQRFPDYGVFVGHGQKVTIDGTVKYFKSPQDLSLEGIFGWMNGNNFMQPSAFFRRDAWGKAGPLDEKIHIALDVDLWIRMARVTKFMGIDQLLSSALIHENAKTTAFVNRMIVDCSLVVARAGGDEYVRPYLERMADQLTQCEQQRAELSRLRSRLSRLGLYAPLSWLARRVAGKALN